MEDFDKLSLKGKCAFVEYLIGKEIKTAEAELAIEKAKQLVYVGYNAEDLIKGLEIKIHVFSWLLNEANNDEEWDGLFDE